MRSRWGVRIVGWPYEARSPQPRSSATTRITFGGPSKSGLAGCRAATAVEAANSTVGSHRRRMTAYLDTSKGANIAFDP
jgi:hypothetical protein